jgi:hypothetical protein
MDLTLWNDRIIFNEAHTYAYFIIKGINYSFELSDTSYMCTVRNTESQKILLCFEDKMQDRTSLIDFTRTFYEDGVEIKSNIYKEGEIQMRTITFKSRWFSKE